jgi:hypothetical protein
MLPVMQEAILIFLEIWGTKAIKPEGFVGV